LYTRTRDLVNGFAEVLDLADEVILLPIYPARELPIEGVSSEMILEKMKNVNLPAGLRRPKPLATARRHSKKVLSKEDLLKWIKNDYVKNLNTEFGQVLITAGAGDIDLMVEPIKEILEKI
jgi:UDP-N-acetylmuramate--alanine ligase